MISRHLLSLIAGLLAFLPIVGSAQNQLMPPGTPSAPPGMPPAPTQAPIVRAIDIQYAGAETVSREKILANMRTRVGHAYSQQLIEDDIRSLYATGNVSNVRIFGEPQADGVKVVVVLAGKAKVASVEFTGVTRFKPKAVRKQVSTKVGDILSEATLEADRQKLLEYYTGKGYADTDVKTNVEMQEKGGNAKITFVVTEGTKTKVRSVKFEGNTKFKTKELAKVVKTQRKTIYNFLVGKVGQLDSDQVEEDVTALKEFYQDHGYIDVKVTAPRVDRKGDKVDVVYLINEGQQYHVAKINYGAVKVFTEADVIRVTKLRPGSVYSPSGMRADIKSFQDLYGSHGYVDFQAGATTTPAGPLLVNINYSVEEGSQSYVEHVNISGNTRTKDKVIRREVLVQPGDIADTVRMDASKKRLENLNYFSRVEVYPEDTLIPGRKDVNVQLEEKRTGSFNFGAGFSSIDSLLGFAEVTQSNFDITKFPTFTGGGERFRIRVQYGVLRRDVVISLTEPYFLDYKLSLNGEAYFREASFVSNVYDERRYGFDITSRKSLNDFTFVRFGYRLEDAGLTHVDSSASQVIHDQARSYLKSEFTVGITYDSRDSVFLTRRGEKLDLSIFAAGGPFGASEQIYGWNALASKYFHLPGDLIFTLTGEAGMVTAWGDFPDVPLYDRLFLGGANNLRGFLFRYATPKDVNGEPLGGDTLVRGTAELTYPIIQKVRGAIFYDTGFVNSQAYNFAPTKDPNGTGGLNADYGIGFRLELPIGPIRVDYGIPIQHDRATGSGGKFNFNIGYQF